MKKPLASCLVMLLLAQPGFAQWAAHLVISPSALAPDPKTGEASPFNHNASGLARAVSVSENADSRIKVAIAQLADQAESGKGYYLVTSKKRLPANALNLRHALASWNRTAGLGGSVRRPEEIDAIRPLKPSQRNGTNVIEVVLDRERAMRSYVVWDFKIIYEKGAMVMDGGLWLTYDLPAFVEASQKSQPTKPK